MAQEVAAAKLREEADELLDSLELGAYGQCNSVGPQAQASFRIVRFTLNFTSRAAFRAWRGGGDEKRPSTFLRPAGLRTEQEEL